MQPDRGKTFAHQALQVTCFVNFLSLEAQSLTTTSNDRLLWLSRTSLKSNSKSLEPKNTELAKKKTAFNTFEYGSFWIFFWYCHTFWKEATLKVPGFSWCVFCPLLASLPKTEHLKKSRSHWFDPNLQQIHDWWSPSATEMQSALQMAFSIEFWQPEVAISGKCLRMRKKNYNPKMLSSSKISENSFIWRMKKTSRFRFFSMKNTKAYPIQSCVGAVQEMQSIVEAWIASKGLKDCSAVDEVVQQVPWFCRFWNIL